VRDHAGSAHEMFFTSRDTPWYIGSPNSAAWRLTFRVLRSFQSEMPTSSRLKISSNRQPCMFSFRFWNVFERNALAIWDRCSSCGALSAGRRQADQGERMDLLVLG
jgi:hypothetical protein